MNGCWCALATIAVLSLPSFGCRGKHEGLKPDTTAEQEFRLPESSIYSEKELITLKLCVGLGDVAWHVADGKRQGKSLEEQLDIYRGKPQAELTREIARDVYRQEGSVFDIVSSFLRMCAGDVAKLAGDRGSVARHCLNVQHVALEAYALRHRGQSRTSALQQFGVLPFAKPIVGRVYDRKVDETDWTQREDIVFDEWVACMEEV